MFKEALDQELFLIPSQPVFAFILALYSAEGCRGYKEYDIAPHLKELIITVLVALLQAKL